jgi:hypothetical protein
MLTTIRRVIAGALLVLSAAASNAADELTDLWNQLRELELRFEEMKRVIPLAEDDSLAEVERFVTLRAKAAGLPAIDAFRTAGGGTVTVPLRP